MLIGVRGILLIGVRGITTTITTSWGLSVFKHTGKIPRSSTAPHQGELFSLTRLCLEGFLLNFLKGSGRSGALEGSPGSAQPVPRANLKPAQPA